jgi:hypothetical protein
MRMNHYAMAAIIKSWWMARIKEGDYIKGWQQGRYSTVRWLLEDQPEARKEVARIIRLSRSIDKEARGDN